MKCLNCQREIADGSSFCTNCGALANLDGNNKNDSDEIQAEDSAPNRAVNTDPVEASKLTMGSNKAENTELTNSAKNSESVDEAISAEKMKPKKNFDESMVKIMQTRVRPLRTWSFIWREIISYLPIINLIVFFIQAFADGVNLNSRSYARAKLVKYLLATIILLVAIGAFLLYYNETIIIIREFIDMLYESIH